MSKLYNLYNQMKQKDPDKLYIFKSGMFYLFLQEDAETISKMLGFKITKLNENVIKCGFPTSRFEYYINLFKKENINFEVVDSNYAKIDNYEDYMNNNKLKKIVHEIQNIDLDNISFKQAFETLEKMQSEINKIYK